MKCASDCYILHAFLNGERSKEIQDVFTYSPSISNDTVVIEDEQDTPDLTSVFIKPDVLAILSNIQADVAEIAKQ